MGFFKKKSNQEPLIVGIGGRTCSGKGVVTEALASVNREVLLLQADCYFHKNTSCSYKGYPCLEHTNCISFERLIDNLHSMKKGKDTVIRIETPWMMPQGKEEISVELSREDIREKKLIIVDGFLIFAVQELVDLFDYKIFIDVSDVNVLYRRQMRNGVEQINYIYNVVIPVSKEYEQIQKDNANVIVDGDMPKEEVINGAGRYLREILSQGNADFRIGLPPKRSPWKVYPDDLLMDHEWHPIDYENLKDWVKERRDRLDAGEEIKGNTFRYRTNPHSGTYEVRLSHKYTICRYTREPTPPWQS